jgi:hypothetical protein
LPAAVSFIRLANHEKLRGEVSWTYFPLLVVILTNLSVSQTPPLVAELMFEDVYANVFAGKVLEAVLGPRPSLRYMNGNTALVSDSRQAVHADLEWRHPHAPFALTIR